MKGELLVFLCLVGTCLAYYKPVYYYNSVWWKQGLTVTLDYYDSQSTGMITCSASGWYYAYVSDAHEFSNGVQFVNSNSVNDNEVCNTGDYYTINFDGQLFAINSTGCGGNFIYGFCK